MIKNILVPVDGSEHSEKALKFACSLAEKYSGELFVITVIENYPESRPTLMGPSHLASQTDKEYAEKHGKPIIDTAIDIAKCSGCNIRKTDILWGTPARGIVDFASGNSIDTIVIGSRGLGDIAGIILGSVSHKVNQLATCTCITIR